MKHSHLVVAWILFYLSTPAVAVDPKPTLPRAGMAIYQYSAETSAKARSQGTVAAGGLSWHCMGNRCTVSGPWPTPAVSSCKALAIVVGPVRRFGHPGAQLNASQLSQCNAGLPVTAPASKPTVRSTKSAGFAQSPIKPATPLAAPKITSPPAVDARHQSRAVTQKDIAPLTGLSNTNIGRAKVEPHYQLGDKKTGEVTFGDGKHGARPPSGDLSKYRSNTGATTPPVIAGSGKPSGFASAPAKSFATPSGPGKGSSAPAAKTPSANTTEHKAIVIKANPLRFVGIATRGPVVINARPLRFIGSPVRGPVVINANAIRFSGSPAGDTDKGSVVINTAPLRFAGSLPHAPIIINSRPIVFNGVSR